MTNDSFVEKLAAGLGQSASVRNVFGEPIQSGDKTIIPVAKVAYGFGGGSGQGMQKPKRVQEETGHPTEETIGEGSGGGGGLYARPKGVYEIAPSGTRFIPAISAGQVLVGVAIGFLLKAIFFSRKRS